MIYWRRSKIPELKKVPAELSDKAWAFARWKKFRHWQVWAGHLFSTVSVVTGAVIGMYYYSKLGVVFLGAIIITAGLIGNLIINHFSIQFSIPYMKEYLEKSKIKVENNH